MIKLRILPLLIFITVLFSCNNKTQNGEEQSINDTTILDSLIWKKQNVRDTFMGIDIEELDVEIPMILNTIHYTQITFLATKI